MIANMRHLAAEIAAQREQLLHSAASRLMTPLQVDVGQRLAAALKEINAAVYVLECGQAGKAWPCRMCDGAGHIPSLPCPACAGVGEVQGQPCEECDGQGCLQSVECSMCAGTGYFVPAAGQCPRCGAVDGLHAPNCLERVWPITGKRAG